MGGTEINQLLTYNQYQAIKNANNPTGLNPFLTLADLSTSGNYGNFSDSTNQVFVANTDTPVTFNTTINVNGVSIGAPTSRIVIANDGVYNINFSGQVVHAAGVAVATTVWLRKNGVDIGDSARDFSVLGDALPYVIETAWLVDALATDYYEVVFSTPEADITLTVIPARIGPVRPPAPSAILIVTQGSSGGVTGNIRSEVNWPVDSQVIRIGITPVGAINTLSYPVDAAVIPGKTRRIVLLVNYSKTIGVSTTQWSFVIGSTTLTCVATAMGNAVIANQMYQIEIFISYKSTGVNKADMVVLLKRHDSATGSPLEQLLASATTASVVGIWDLAIANTVITRYQTISGSPTHTLTIVSVTSELL